MKIQHIEYVKKDEAHISDLQRQMEQLHEDLRIEKQSNMVLLAQKNDAEVAVVEEHEPEPKKSWWRRLFDL